MMFVDHERIKVETKMVSGVGKESIGKEKKINLLSIISFIRLFYRDQVLTPVETNRNRNFFKILCNV